MARAKKPSDEVYNARRRLQRQAARLERDAAKFKNERLRDAAISYAKSLRQVAESARGKQFYTPEFYAEYRALTTPEAREKFLKGRLSKLREVRERAQEAAYSRDARVRSNAIFAQQINAAGIEGADTTLNRNAAKAFWVANKGLWTTGEYVPRNERYARILAEWYGDTENARKLEQWLLEKRMKERKRELGLREDDELPPEERERIMAQRGQIMAEHQGDLQTVYEYIESTLDPDLQNQPELDYERVKKSVYVAH